MCLGDSKFTIRQQSLHIQNGWQNQPGNCDSCKPCNRYFEDGEYNFGENRWYSHDMDAKTASGEKSFQPRSLDILHPSACRVFVDQKCTKSDKCLFQHAGRGREQNAEAVVKEKKAAADDAQYQGVDGL